MRYGIYMSSASSPLPDSELMNIKQKLRGDTEKLGVTGLLVFHRNTFIHFYEGAPGAVEKMLESVQKDKRHTAVKIIGEGESKERQFPSASMELRVLDKDPLFVASDLAHDREGIKKRINECFMQIT